METYQNLEYVQNKAAYPRGFFSDRSRRDIPVPAMPAEFNAASNARLTSSPMDPEASSISEDDSYQKDAGLSIVGRLQVSSIDAGVVMAVMLAMGTFVGLAIWAVATVQGELHDDDPDAADDTNAAALHFQKFGKLRPSLDLNRLETTEKGIYRRKTLVVPKPPSQKKSSSYPLSHQVGKGSTRNARRVGRNRDLGTWTASSEVEYTEEAVAPWSSEREDAPVAPTQRRVGGGRRLPSKKPGRRSARRGQNQHAHQRRRVQQHAVAPVGDVEKDFVNSTTMDTAR